MIVLYIIIGYLTQMAIASIINMYNEVPRPTEYKEYVVFTFLPYILYKIYKEKKASK
jgi:hypothetical protein